MDDRLFLPLAATPLSLSPVLWRSEPQLAAVVPQASLAALLARHGGRVFWTLALTHAILSVVAPAIGFHTLPRDTIEGFLWG
ncbi:hypothetical protein C8P69_1311, partial [Phreatobacter oligotrophus]